MTSLRFSGIALCLTACFLAPWKLDAQAVFQLNGHNYVATLDHISVEDGLVYREVSSIFQDSRGFMWFGTHGGLNRYDGYAMQTWTLQELGFNKTVLVMAEDPEGYLWLSNSDLSATTDDLAFLHTESLELLSFQERFQEDADLVSNPIQPGLTVDQEGNIYFLSDTGNTLYSYSPEKGFERRQVRFYSDLSLVEATNRNTFWAKCGTSNWSTQSQNDTLLELGPDGDILNEYPLEGNIKATNAFYRGDTFWFFEVLKEDYGNFVRLSPNGVMTKVSLKDIPPLKSYMIQPANAAFLSLREEPKTGTILATKYGHPLLFHPESGEVQDLGLHFPALKNDQVIGERGFFRDNKGDLWLGGNFGVYHLHIEKSPFKTYFHQNLQFALNQRSGISCRQLFPYGNGLYVAAEIAGVLPLKGPAIWSGDRLSSIRHNAAFFSFLEAQDGTCYLGTTPIPVRKPPGAARFEHLKLPEDNFLLAWCFFEDDRQRLWVGSQVGLFYLDPESDHIRRFEGYNSFRSLENISIYDIQADRSGQIWLCSNYGLFQLDPEQGLTGHFSSEQAPPFNLPLKGLHHFYEDADGVFWLATNGNGLVRWDRQKQEIESFTVESGLPNNVIYAVYEDDFGALWLSSDYGIVQFDKQTHAVHAYLPKDGVSHFEFNKVSHFQDQDGTLYFGSLNGVTSFHPRDLQEPVATPDAPLAIVEFLQFDGQSNRLVDRTKEILQSGKIRMLPQDRFFLLRFSLLNYADMDKVRYAYLVEGIDEDWNEQAENSLRLGRLPYGSHILRIKGKSAEGLWGAQELAIQVEVVRPFYLQAWFIALCLLLLAGGLFLLYRFSMARRLARQETRRLRDLNELKTRLYTNISHEFRTPLTVILGMADKLQERSDSWEIPESTKQDLHSDLHRIHHNGEQLLSLVNQLMDLSKLDAQLLRLHLQQWDIIPFLRYLVESFYSNAEEKKVRLVFDPETEQLWMDFDEMRVQQVVYNLVSNALKFTPSGGQVVIRAVELDSDPPQLELTVRDTGIGIPPEMLPHIFDRFYQVEGQVGRAEHGRSASVRKAFEGTGIGLALTRELVELMGGTIGVQSTPGKGTRFTVHLPITREAARKEPAFSTAAPPISRPAGGHLTLPVEPEDGKWQLLVIEDNRDIAAYIRDCVQDEYQVHLAHDGQEGIERALELIPEVIISDVMMPVKDGLEVLRTLKNDQRTSHIPIILLTAKATTDDRIIGLKEGADAYLSKPFHKEELLVRMEQMVKLRETLQQRYSQFVPAQAPVRALSLEEQFLQKVNECVEAELGNPELGAEQICRATLLSQAQLYRKLKALTGKTPALFIRSIRLEKARSLLQSGRYNVSEVAYETGFTDPNYFSRVFSKEYGKSPSSFTKN